jgi:hypothetical protein
MADIVFARATLLDILTKATAVAGEFDTGVIALFVDAIVPTPLTLLAQLTECTFPGYARSAAVKWGTPYFDTLERAVSLSDVHQFACNAVGQAQTARIVGLIVGAAPGVLKACYVLDTPLIFASPDSVFQVAFEAILGEPTGGLADIIP